VVVTTFFICSGGNQGGNYLWWRTISLFLIWEINFCDLKFVGLYVFQLSIFIPREARS
jgi:hypothetical protein